VSLDADDLEKAVKASIWPLVFKGCAVALAAGASFITGEFRGEAVGNASGVAETQMQLVSPIVVLHLSTVIADLERQLKIEQGRVCAQPEETP
jgi:hypothetical protein